PYLREILIGRAPTGQLASTTDDAHNFFELRYSEPVDIGDLAPTVTNVRADSTFANGTEHGGHVVDNADAALLIGFFQFTDATYSSATPLRTGDRTSPGDANDNL